MGEIFYLTYTRVQVKGRKIIYNLKKYVIDLIDFTLWLVGWIEVTITSEC